MNLISWVSTDSHQRPLRFVTIHSDSEKFGAYKLTRNNEVMYRVAQGKWYSMSDAASGYSDGRKDEDIRYPEAMWVGTLSRMKEI